MEKMNAERPMNLGTLRLGGIGQTRWRRKIEARTGFETRAVVLGHIQARVDRQRPF